VTVVYLTEAYKAQVREAERKRHEAEAARAELNALIARFQGEASHLRTRMMAVAELYGSIEDPNWAYRILLREAATARKSSPQ